MNRLPLIAILFMSGMVFNCLRQLLAWSVSITREVLLTGTVMLLVLAALGLLAELIAYHRARRSRRTP